MENNTLWLSESKNGCFITIKAVPKSSKTEITEIKNEYIKLRVKGAPHDNEANSEITAFLSRIFKIPKTAVIIKSGKTGKNKLIELNGLNSNRVSAIIRENLH